jgi:adenylate cyclase class 2
MAYETEMKAWVDDWQAVELHLRQRLEFNREFTKRDRYYASSDVLASDHGNDRTSRAVDSPPAGPTFRLRSDGDHCVVTFKAKSVRSGIEFNHEHEFSVDDGQAFHTFATHIGFSQDAEKVKRGLSFSDGDLHIELVEVEGLGAFLEVEFVNEDGDEELHAEAGRRIREVLRIAGIPDSRVESRPYNQLLRERRAT